jgi:hypothetical protein
MTSAPVAAGRVRAGALFCLLAGPALASPPPAPDVRVSVERRDDGLFAIDGRFVVPASTGTAWAVLTDYDRIPAFVSSMKASRVAESRPDGTLIVEQTAVGRMFMVSKRLRVKLEVRRDDDLLSFNDFGRADFWIYSGSWSVLPGPDGSEVRYRLLAQPDFPAPGFLLGGAMRRGARDLLEEVRAEMRRRSLSPESPEIRRAPEPPKKESRAGPTLRPAQNGASAGNHRNATTAAAETALTLQTRRS